MKTITLDYDLGTYVQARNWCQTNLGDEAEWFWTTSPQNVWHGSIDISDMKWVFHNESDALLFEQTFA